MMNAVNGRSFYRKTLQPLFAVSILAGAPYHQALAQPGPPGPPPPPPPSRSIAPEDITGNWVSVVTEDYRWRVVVPPKGDYASVPLNPAGRMAADAWDPDQDRVGGNACKAYGPGNLMRIVGRAKIHWEGDEALIIETDKGQQRREIHFNDGATPGTPSLQGFSKGEVAKTTSSRGFFPNNYYTHIAAVTTNHTGGYLRLNGVPYSENAVINGALYPIGRLWRAVVDSDDGRGGSQVSRDALCH